VATSQGQQHRLDAAPPPADPDAAGRPDYSANALPLRVEVRRQLKRRRTQIAYGLLFVVPFLLILAFKVGSSSKSSGAPGLVDLATRGAANFTLFAIYVSTGFLLVVVVALFAGDTVASEASWSSLRYLLIAPVPRSRLLRQKLLVSLMSSAVAIVGLPVVAYLAGGVAFGWAPPESPLGNTIGNGQALLRLLVIAGYLMTTLLLVASLAFFLGVCTDAPLGAVGGAVLIIIVSDILDAVSALGGLRHFLPTHYEFSWLDALSPSISWGGMARGAIAAGSYSAILLVAAWYRFASKDITS
jgi:ABC-2 type transport system permease protein